MSADPGTLRILCLSGPNLQLLGRREPEIYGTQTLADLHAALVARGLELDAAVTCRQSNSEGQLLDWIAETFDAFDGLLLNGGAYTHTSLALYDALRAIPVPCIEVHLSNPEAREGYRHESRIAGACLAKVAGFGPLSYQLALEGLCAHLRKTIRG